MNYTKTKEYTNVHLLCGVFEYLNDLELTHRLDGPAKIYSNPFILPEYYINGYRYLYYEYIKQPEVILYNRSKKIKNIINE